MKATALAVALLCVLMSSAAQLAMKLGLRGGDAAGSVAGTYAHALGSPLVWLGLALYGLSAALWIWVLSRLDVSLAYPLVSLGFVFALRQPEPPAPAPPAPLPPLMTAAEPIPASVTAEQLERTRFQ